MSRRAIISVASLGAFIIFSAFDGIAQSAPRSSPTVTLEINGTIKNYTELMALVEPGTYIQLVPMAPDGSAESQVQEGRFSFKSPLVKLGVPKKAAFSFHVPNTPPGRYFLAAQRLLPHSSRGQQPPPPMFLTAQRQVFTIEVGADSKSRYPVKATIQVPADAKSPFTVAVGDLLVLTQ